MPFTSKAQARMMFATKPGMAREWADKTPDIGGLPERAHKRLRKLGLRNEAKQQAQANSKTPFKVPEVRGGPIQTMGR